MCTPKSCLAAAAFAAAFFSSSAGAQTPASGPQSFERSVSESLAPDSGLFLSADKKASAEAETGAFKEEAFRGGGPGGGGFHPAPRPEPRPGPRPEPRPEPRPGPGPGPGRGDIRRGGDWGRWPNHPGWGAYYNRWNWVGLAPHWWGWALWAGAANRAACVNWYAGEMNSCNSSCAAENNSCVSACYGDAACAAQCSANAGYCSNTCSADYSAKIGLCPL